MKSLSLALCLIALCAFASDSPAPIRRGSDVGRYRLLRAVVSSARAGDSQCVFKIDSVTGRTWRYFGAAVKTNWSEAFIEIDDVNSSKRLAREDSTTVNQWVAWCATHPNGGTITNEEGNVTSLDAIAVSNMFYDLRSLLRQSNTYESHSSH